MDTTTQAHVDREAFYTAAEERAAITLDGHRYTLGEYYWIDEHRQQVTDFSITDKLDAAFEASCAL